MYKSNKPDGRTPAITVQKQAVNTVIDPNEHRPQGELFPVTQIEVDGVQMGVLNDGTPYLTLRGLARMCGIDHTVLLRMANNWDDERDKPRGRKIQQLLDAQGYQENFLYTRTKDSSAETHAYTDAVCMAILEYYAFDSAQGAGTIALQNYRILARDSFRNFIYKRCAFDPNKQLAAGWQNFHDRVSLTYDSVPVGYFGIFKEISNMIVTLGQAGLHIDSSFVPDISVGISWSSHWKGVNGDTRFGERQKFEHNYPDYFPQAQSNPQEPWCYPDAALGEFRRWFREEYVGHGKFKNYLDGVVSKKKLPIEFARQALAAYDKDTPLLG